jgi:hypothetical protein
MDDEQRERMQALKRAAWRTAAFGAAFFAFSIGLGIVGFGDWTRYLLMGAIMVVAPDVFVLVSNWRYIRRGPFPRLPASMRDERPRR